MSKRKAVKPYSSPLSQPTFAFGLGEDGKLHRADGALVLRWVTDLEKLAQANFPDLSAVPPARREDLLLALPLAPGWRLSAKKDRAREALLYALRLRRAVKARDVIAAAKAALLLGVVAEQLHATHLLDLGDKESTTQRRRVEKRWRKTAEARAKRNQRWAEWNKKLLQRGLSERERSRLIAKKSKELGDPGASEANVRLVLRGAG